ELGPDGRDHRRAHPARGVPPARAAGARRADGRAARAQRLGVLPPGGRVLRVQHAHERRGPAGGLPAAQPRDVRLQPDGRAGDRLPRRAHAVGRDGVGHRARGARPPRPSLRGAAGQVARARGLRQRLHRARRAGAVRRRLGDRGLLATAAGGRPRAARGADHRAAHPRGPALDRRLADGVGRGRGRPLRRHLGRRRGGRRGRLARQRGPRARRHGLAGPAAHRRPVARRDARLPGPFADHRLLRRRRGLPVPEHGAADGGLPRLGGAVGGDDLGAGRGVVPAQGPV
ncbi:MAG: ABC-type transport system involved in multi-copper enzyme maturation, permease component, partial [uncultured Thermoleophilia bacterium]